MVNIFDSWPMALLSELNILTFEPIKLSVLGLQPVASYFQRFCCSTCHSKSILHHMVFRNGTVLCYSYEQYDKWNISMLNTKIRTRALALLGAQGRRSRGVWGVNGRPWCRTVNGNKKCKWRRKMKTRNRSQIWSKRIEKPGKASLKTFAITFYSKYAEN